MVRFSWCLFLGLSVLSYCAPIRADDEPTPPSSADSSSVESSTAEPDSIEPAGEEPTTPEPSAPDKFGDEPSSEQKSDDEKPSKEQPAEDSPADVPPAKAKPAAPAPNAGQKFNLKYKFTAGEVVRTEIVHRATVQTTIQGTSQTAETLSKSIKAWQVNDVTPEGIVTFVHSVESIEMWQKTQGRQEVRYNSKTDTEVPPGYEDAASAVGVPLTIATMDSFGNILKRQEKRPQPTSVSTQMTMPLPSHPVVVGDTWSSPMEIDVILKDNSVKKIQTRQLFTLKKVVDDVATIEVDSQVLTPIHDPAIEAQLIQRLSKGDVRFDMTAGRILGQQLDLDRRVIGFSGPTSSMHYLTRFTEQLLPANQQTARRAAPTANSTAPSTKSEPVKPAPSGKVVASDKTPTPGKATAKKKTEPRR